MAVRLRLVRMGKKKQPTYRVVAADSRSPRDGRFLEIIGFYEPRQDPSVVRIDNERALHWLRHGAQPTERVEKLLRISGAWDTFTTGATAPAAVPAAGMPAAATPTPAAAAPVAPAAAAVPVPAAASAVPAAANSGDGESNGDPASVG